MSTYRSRERSRPVVQRRRGWFGSLPPRVQTLLVGSVMLGGFILASWADDPTPAEPYRMPPLEVESPGPWSWWER